MPLTESPGSSSRRQTVSWRFLLRQERLAVQGRLIRSMVHEIGNPLQAVSAALDLALEDLASQPVEELREYLDLALKEVSRIEDLLSRVRLLYLAASASVVDLHDVLQDVATLLRKEMQWAGLAYRPRWCSEPLPVQVSCRSLHLALTGIWLSLVSASRKQDTLEVSTRHQGKWAEVMFVLRSEGASLQDVGDMKNRAVADALELELSKEMLAACGGECEFQTEPTGIWAEIRLPAV